MKEYHAINILEGIFENCVRDNDKEYIEKNLAFAEAVKALSEIQQYRAVGTVEECREARERQRMKKPIHGGPYACPNCHTIMLQGAFEAKGKCCKECGQSIDWSDTN